MEPAHFRTLRGISLRFSSSLSRVLSTLLILGLAGVAAAKPSAEDIAKLFPRELGGFRVAGSIQPNRALGSAGILNPSIVTAPAGFPGFAGGEAEYISADGEKFQVELIRVERDSDAYSLLTILARSARETGQADISRDIGTAGFASRGRVAFFKGTTFVVISSAKKDADPQQLKAFAKLFADRLEKGEGDIPVLVKHVPQWETAQANAVYLAGFRSLKGTVSNQPVLEAVSSEGDADAVVTTYGNTKFVLIEFNTPQLAGDNDRAIAAKIQELRSQGQPVPTAYRKVGNYSVFVFDAPAEQAANDLIDKVEYAQVVQWLGNNPYLLEKAQRDYYETTAGVLVSVVKASGLSLLACLTIGGLMGALLFGRRRAQQRAAEAFSDAGGMLRLNLDEITPQHDPAKLLGPGN